MVPNGPNGVSPVDLRASSFGSFLVERPPPHIGANSSLGFLLNIALLSFVHLLFPPYHNRICFLVRLIEACVVIVKLSTRAKRICAFPYCYLEIHGLNWYDIIHLAMALWCGRTRCCLLVAAFEGFECADCQVRVPCPPLVCLFTELVCIIGRRMARW